VVEESVMDTVTTAGAGAAVVSPWWLPLLTSSHDAAQFLLPFAGLAWLVIQAYYKIKKERNNK
jgi:hypothetical protein